VVINLNHKATTFASRREAAVRRKVWGYLNEELMKGSRALRELEFLLKAECARCFRNQCAQPLWLPFALAFIVHASPRFRADLEPPLGKRYRRRAAERDR
jgi:hypothetical protein